MTAGHKKINTIKNWVPFLLFSIILISGLLSFKDYGIAWDEPIQRNLGIITWHYLEGDNALLTYKDRYYGSILECSYTALEHLFHLTDPRSIYLMRHLCGFLIFYLGLICFYLILYHRFKQKRLAYLGVLCLWLSPRIFAHAFFNAKDIPFLSVFIISFYCLILYTKRNNPIYVVLHSLVSALLINLRIIGVLMIGFTILYDSVDFVCFKNKKAWHQSLIYGLLTSLLTIALWPAAWAHPIKFIREAIVMMQQFPWNGDVLYMGQFINSSQLPWHYFPVWFSITTPMGYLILGLLGIGYALTRIKSIKQNPDHVWDLLMLLWFAMPISYILLMHPVLYDDWRHFYFVYPAFISLGILCFHAITKKIKKKYITILGYSLTGIYLIYTALTMHYYHPYEHVYFNALAGPKETLKYRFELDYWGTSYKDALLQILNSDPKKNLKILVTDFPGMANSLILKKEDRDRLYYVATIKDADYYITNFRWQPKIHVLPVSAAILVNEIPINYIFKAARISQ